MNKEELIKEAEKLHEEFEGIRDISEKLNRNLELMESLENYLEDRNSSR